ncbi:hypothetical protein [Novosphingobium kaempferiae]|uniref:hypothetical protein n=1 Tax=Novosphingobium kaempferiae TaxID=2896849 RepID=UPI001E56B0D1|nr:hypothetical protein [Novosphingobium kaempferiae]
MNVAHQHEEMHRRAAVRVSRAELPDLATPTGMFGSRRDRTRLEACDDDQAGLMSCLYPFHREG